MIPLHRTSRRPARGSEDTGISHTLCGAREAEARVTQDLARLTAAIDGELGASLHALLLLGPYARGEGSVVEQAGELQAKSCYELLAVLRGAERGELDALLERISTTWRAQLGVGVHLSARSLGELERAAPALTWVDVAAGQVEVLTGDASVLGRLRSLHPHDVPAEAWAWSLTDAALAIAVANLDESVRARGGPRDLHEAALACGDALLFQLAHYTFEAKERSAELSRVEVAHGVDGLAAAYADALEYQARPDRWLSTHDAQAPAFRPARIAVLSQAHLKIEHTRLGTALDPLSYALFMQRVWSGTSYLAMRALRANLRCARMGVAGDNRVGDARERLARAAVLLAYQPTRLPARNLAARLLRLRNDDTPSPDDQELLDGLRRLRAETERSRHDDPLAGARYGRS